MTERKSLSLIDKKRKKKKLITKEKIQKKKNVNQEKENIQPTPEINKEVKEEEKVIVSEKVQSIMEETPLMTSTLTQEEIVKVLEEARREEPMSLEQYTVEEGAEEGMELDPSLIETIMKSLMIESNTYELFCREEHRFKSFGNERIFLCWRRKYH